jgi:hypothetical protein
MKKIDLSKINVSSPSQFMRELRPEYYSDTEDRVVYSLGREVLEYHLHSITQRNETHSFEVFCRKLCERTICPNLRSHTGPDGGGDSKVDTETYLVSDEISTLFLVGYPDAGRERWAFAISAKEEWRHKALADVAKIIETKRDYKKIFFITSMFARDKDRANIEDTLSKQYGVPVIIHDRSWIVKEVIENDRKDIAYHYLSIGEEKSDPFRLGPEDYSRARQLSDIEKDFDDPNTFQGMKMQRVTEALIAAKLSRNLERPRFETDGRFARAIRLADVDGTSRQKLEVKYEQIWTAFWWFDDFQFLKDSYESVENIAIISEHAIDLEWLCNLYQLLVNSVLHKHMTLDECKFEERQSRLIKALEKLVGDSERPNNSLEAETSLLIIRMNQAWMEKDGKKLTQVWNDFSTIIEKADGLGEFKAGRLKKMIEVAGLIAGNDPAYDNLVEKVAEFISRRESDVSGAKILLERAKQLDFDSNFQILRLLGKAAIQLNKAEYRDYLIEALWLLMLAYRSAGLLWAARATCITLAATIVKCGKDYTQGEETLQ